MHNPWAQFLPATIQFCENRLDAWIREPANTWSSLAFVLAGHWILREAGRTPFRFLATIGWASLAIGWGSVAFHASATFIGETIDVSAMYILTSYLIASHLVFMGFGHNKGLIATVFLGTLVGPIALMQWQQNSGIFVFAFLVSIVILQGFYLRKMFSSFRKEVLTILLLFSVSYFIWNLDYHHILCDPHNHWIQGHAVWHILNALCIYAIYRLHFKLALKNFS